MAQTPDIKVRLTPQGVTEIIQALRQVQNEANKAQSKTRSGLVGVQATLDSIKGALPAIGFTAAITGFTVMAKHAADFADEMGKGAQQVGTTAENLSVLSAAAATADVEGSALVSSLSRLVKNIGELKQGTEEQVEAFEELGLSAKDFAGKDTVEAFDLIAGRISKVQDPTEKTELALRIFGKSGAKLIPLMNDLARTGFAAVREQAEKLGIVVSGDLANAAEAMNDSFTLMGQQAKGLALQFVAGLAPAIVSVFSTLQEETAGDGTKAMFDFGEAVGRVFGPVIATLQLVGNLVGNIIGGIAEQLGAGAAVLVSLASGEFRQAGRIMMDNLERVRARGTVLFDDLFKDIERVNRSMGANIKPIEPKIKPKVDVDAVESAAQDVATRFKKLFGKSNVTDLKDVQDAERKRFEVAERIRENEADLMRDLLRLRTEGNARLLYVEEQLTMAEFHQLSLRMQARMETYQAELAILDKRDAVVRAQIAKQYGDTKTGKALLLELEKQTGKDRLAVETKYVEDLIKLRDTYVQKYKGSIAVIKNLDAEVKNNQKEDAAAIRSARLELLTDEQKFLQLSGEARAKLDELKKAVGTGDLERARQLRKEIQEITGEILRTKPEGVDKKDVVNLGDQILGESRKLLELIIAKERVAEEAKVAAAAGNINFLTSQIEAAKAKLDAFFAEQGGKELKLRTTVDDNAMASTIAAIRKRLEEEKFIINVTPAVAQAAGGTVPRLAHGGRIRGTSPTPTADNILIAATAGEFMQPVRAVRHYGSDFMESVRTLSFPRYANGGAVGGGGSTPAGERVELALTLNDNSVGSVFGPRDTVSALVDALKQLDKG